MNILEMLSIILFYCNLSQSDEKIYIFLIFWQILRHDETLSSQRVIFGNNWQDQSSFGRTYIHFLNIPLNIYGMWFYGVMASIVDFEYTDPISTLGRTLLFEKDWYVSSVMCRWFIWVRSKQQI